MDTPQTSVRTSDFSQPNGQLNKKTESVKAVNDDMWWQFTSVRKQNNPQSLLLSHTRKNTHTLTHSL